MALNRAQHVIEHIDSIKEAVVRYKYNIFIPGMKKKRGVFVRNLQMANIVELKLGFATFCGSRKH